MEALIKSTCADSRQKFSLARKKSAGIIGLFQTFLTLSRGNFWREDVCGDLISGSIYQGNQITIYYAQNSWNFTRLGKINDITARKLKEILGAGDVSVTLSPEQPE